MYQVWTQQYGEEWHMAECAGPEEVKEAIMEGLKAGHDVKLTQELPFDLKLTIKEPREDKKKTEKPLVVLGETKIKEVDKSGAKESGPEEDKSTGS